MILWFLHTPASHACCAEQLHTSVLPRVSFCHLISLQLSLWSLPSFNRLLWSHQNHLLVTGAFMTVEKQTPQPKLYLSIRLNIRLLNAFCTEPSSRPLIFVALITSVSPPKNPLFQTSIILIISCKAASKLQIMKITFRVWLDLQRKWAAHEFLEPTCSVWELQQDREALMSFLKKTLIQSDTKYLHLEWVWQKQ